MINFSAKNLGVLVMVPLLLITNHLSAAPPEEDLEVKYERLFNEFRKEELRKCSEPVLGKIYRIEVDSETVSGKLIKAGKDTVTVQVDGEEGEIYANEVSLSTKRQLFPDAYAEEVAFTRVDRIIAKEGNLKSGAISPKEITSTPSKKLPPLGKYDPTYTKTPKILGTAIIKFGRWLQYQGNRSGGRLATRLYAKQHGDQIVLYMEPSKFYLAQEKAVRLAACNQFWRMWAQQCVEMGVISSISKAHLVLVASDGKILGGSKEEKASRVWVRS